MYIKSVALKNFRNYETLSLDDFSVGMNVIGGKNAQGKTNLLEAFCLCAEGKSFRVGKDSVMIKDGEEQAYVKIVYNDGRDKVIETLLERRKKYFNLNGEPLKRMKELYGNLCIVVFSPEDLKIIREAPNLRRRFLDIEISRIRPSYIEALKNYQKLLNEKSAVLKKSKERRLISVYNERLAKVAALINKNRALYCEKLNEYTNKTLGNMKISEKVEFTYRPSLKSEELLRELELLMDAEIRDGQCLAGPQRDEIVISINGREAKFFASQGQTRSIMLAMKIAAVYISYEWTKKTAVLLLDDVFSELDRERKNWIVKSVKNIQTFITTAQSDEAVKIGGNVYIVNEGKITRAQ